MFEIGKTYEFRTFEGGDETSWHGVVEKYEHPLLKTADRHFSDESLFFPGGTVRGRIVNVISPAFIGASLVVSAEDAGEGKSESFADIMEAAVKRATDGREDEGA